MYILLGKSFFFKGNQMANIFFWVGPFLVGREVTANKQNFILGLIFIMQGQTKLIHRFSFFLQAVCCRVQNKGKLNISDHTIPGQVACDLHSGLPNSNQHDHVASNSNFW